MTSGHGPGLFLGRAEQNRDIKPFGVAESQMNDVQRPDFQRLCRTGRWQWGRRL